MWKIEILAVLLLDNKQSTQTNPQDHRGSNNLPVHSAVCEQPSV